MTVGVYSSPFLSYEVDVEGYKSLPYEKGNQLPQNNQFHDCRYLGTIS